MDNLILSIHIPEQIKDTLKSEPGLVKLLEDWHIFMTVILHNDALAFSISTMAYGKIHSENFQLNPSHSSSYLHSIISSKLDNFIDKMFGH